MKQKKDVVINVEPSNASIRRYKGGFEWTFSVTMKDQGFRRKRINMKFERWWLTYLAKDLRKVLEEEWEEIERLQTLTGFIPDHTPVSGEEER